MKAPLFLLLVVALFGAGCSQDAGAQVRLTDPPSDAPAAPTSVAAADSTAQAKAKAPARAAAKAPARAQSVRLTGRTAATRDSQLILRAQGLLAKVHVDEGDQVEAGQVLAEVDDTMARLQVRQARTAVKAAEVQVKGVRREVKRLETLRKRDAVPEAEYERAQTQLEGAQAQVEQAKAHLAMARQGQRDLTLKAPYAGRVITVMKAKGEWVASTPPAPVLVLAQMDPLELRLEAPEQAYGQVKAGSTLAVRLPSVNHTAQVVVKRVIPSVGANRAFTVVAELPNPDGALPAGLFAEAEFTP